MFFINVLEIIEELRVCDASGKDDVNADICVEFRVVAADTGDWVKLKLFENSGGLMNEDENGVRGKDVADGDENEKGTVFAASVDDDSVIVDKGE